MEIIINYIKNCFKWIVYSNLWLVISALAYLNFLQETNLIPLNLAVKILILLGIFCSYSLHWYFTSPTIISNSRSTWNIKYKFIYIPLFILSGVGVLVLLLKNPAFIIPILPAALLTLNYTFPKLPFKLSKKVIGKMLAKDVYLATVWTYVLIIFPLLILKNSFTILHCITICQTFFITFLICKIFNFRNNVSSTNLNKKSIWIVINVAIAILTILFFITSPSYLIKGNSILLITYILAIQALIFTHSKKHSLWYYFLADGILIIPLLINNLILFNF